MSSPFDRPTALVEHLDASDGSRLGAFRLSTSPSHLNAPPAERRIRVPVHRRRFSIGAAPSTSSFLSALAAAAGWRP